MRFLVHYIDLYLSEISGLIAMSNKLISFIKNYCLAKKYANIVSQPISDLHLLARLRYPNGAWVKMYPHNLYKTSRMTCKLSTKNKIIYGGTVVLPSELYASADVLVKEDNDNWQLIEVFDNEATETDIIHDMAFKKYVFDCADFNIRRCIVLKAAQHISTLPVSVSYLFDKQDVTEKVLPICKQFSQIANQDLTPIKGTQKLPTEENTAYIDYIYPYKNSENKSFIHLERPRQYACQIYAAQNTFYLKQYMFLRKMDIYSAQVNFLTSRTRSQDKVYVRNLEFERAHHRQMAEIFKDKAVELNRLNEKLLKWKNYAPLPEAHNDILELFPKQKKG